MSGHRALRAVCAAVAVALTSCAPKLRPLGGAPAPASFPAAALPGGHHRIIFAWSLEDPDLTARGEGAARTAAPDSARLDFFLAGGMGSGAAILIGDDLRLPARGDDIARRLIPPAPLLWAALGRLATPAHSDTVARVDGDTIRADIGQPVAWRVTFVRDSLHRLERVDGGRVQEWVERAPPFGTGRVRYRNETSRRQLELTISRLEPTAAFDPLIWALP